MFQISKTSTKQTLDLHIFCKNQLKKKKKKERKKERYLLWVHTFALRKSMETCCVL